MPWSTGTGCGSWSKRPLAQAFALYSTHGTRTSHSIAHTYVRTCTHTFRGKSFLLTTVYLYCLVHKIKVKAACPTGIAAANIEIEKTAVTATTIHNMFEFDGEYKSRLDFAKLTNAKVADLITMEVLLLDEALHPPFTPEPSGCGSHRRKSIATGVEANSAVTRMCFWFVCRSMIRLIMNSQ